MPSIAKRQRLWIMMRKRFPEIKSCDQLPLKNELRRATAKKHQSSLEIFMIQRKKNVWHHQILFTKTTGEWEVQSRQDGKRQLWERLRQAHPWIIEHCQEIQGCVVGNSLSKRSSDIDPEWTIVWNSSVFVFNSFQIA